MKKLFILILGIVSLTCNAQQQPVLTAEQKAKMEVKRMATDLDLTTVQQQQLEKILLENNRKTGDIKQRLQSAKPEENQTLKEEYIESLKAVLTTEQQDKWDAIYKKRFQGQHQPQNPASAQKAP